MKTKLILLAALMLGGVAQTHARSDSSLMRQASALECLADDIPSSLRRSLAGHCISSEHQRFLDTAHALQIATDRFLCQVREGEDAACLTRSLSSIRSSFSRVRSQASCIRVSSTTRNYMSQFSEVLGSVCINRVSHSHDDHFDHGRDFRRDAPRGEPVSDRDMLIGAIGRLIGGR